MRNIIANSESEWEDNNNKNSIKVDTPEIFNQKKSIFSVLSSKKFLTYFSVCLVIFIAIFTVISNFQIGYAVVFNNKTIAYVSSKAQTVEAMNAINDEIAHSNNSKADYSTKFLPVIKYSKTFVAKKDIKSVIKSNIELYVNGCAIYIDNKFAFASDTKEHAEEMVNNYQKYVVGNGEIVSVKIKNNVTYKTESVLSSKILDSDTAFRELSGTNSQEGLYKVKKGDTLWSIGIDNDIASDYLMTLNNLESDVIKVDQILRVKVPTPLINIEFTKKIAYTEYQPFETKYEYDASLTKGTNKVIQQGSNGESQIEANVTYENSQETGREILAKTVTKDVQSEIVKVGTKPKPKTAATGAFSRPVSGGYISSAFGNRSRGYHTGIDFAVSYGTPVHAADGGTVTAAGWGGGYGNMVKISHGNGMETLYAHNSRLAVKSGQKVAKGQLISYVGSTGNSTGPHLHFEIRKNGRYLNPANYF